MVSAHGPLLVSFAEQRVGAGASATAGSEGCWVVMNVGGGRAERVVMPRRWRRQMNGGVMVGRQLAKQLVGEAAKVSEMVDSKRQQGDVGTVTGSKG